MIGGQDYRKKGLGLGFPLLQKHDLDTQPQLDHCLCGLYSLNCYETETYQKEKQLNSVKKKYFE